MNKSNPFQAVAASSVGGQFALVDKSEGNPFWSGRAMQDDISVHLGEALTLNSLVSNTPIGIASLIHPDQLKATSEWIRFTLKCDSEVSFPGDPDSPDDPRPVLNSAELRKVFELDTSGFPEAYEDWRFSVEVYFVADNVSYMMRDSSAVRMRVLSSDECNAKHSQALLPFEDELDDQFERQLIIIAVVPNRMASLGGLRGYRSSFIHGGVRSCCFAGG